MACFIGIAWLSFAQAMAVDGDGGGGDGGGGDGGGDGGGGDGGGDDGGGGEGGGDGVGGTGGRYGSGGDGGGGNGDLFFSQRCHQHATAVAPTVRHSPTCKDEAMPATKGVSLVPIVIHSCTWQA